MLEGNDAFTKKRIQNALNTVWLGKPALYFPEIDSTNTTLKKMAGEGAPAGTLVVTDYQSAGRGRLDRQWLAPPGTSLLLSLLLRPGWAAPRAGWLTMIAGLAVAEAVETETGLTVGLKWPNDLMLQVAGRWLKAGGLLLESSLDGGRVHTVVLGIGINVNMTAEQLPETATPPASLQIAAGRPLPRLALLNTLLRCLETHYDSANRGDSPHSAWNKRLITRGQPVRVQGGPSRLEGIAEGVDEWGRLLVRERNGRLHLVPAGDVTLRDEA